MSWRAALTWLLAAFFLFGAAGNVFASETIVEDYRRWGYPDGFHYVTGLLELITAILLALPATRLMGSGAGCALMAAAAGTVLVHGEFVHALAPLTIFALAALNGWANSEHFRR